MRDVRHLSMPTSLALLVMHLSFPGCKIEINIISSSVYISGRPFVLRDASEPRRTLPLSDRAENLEAIENRLKNDILLEAAR
jgi:hypothetical protein